MPRAPARFAVTVAANLAATLPAAPALAETPRLPEALTRDGRITMTELADHTMLVFRSLDGDGNGTISRQEFLSFPLPETINLDPEGRRELFDHVDENDDGNIHSGEWAVACDEAAQLTDLDSDGYVSLAELAEMHAQGTLDDAIPADLLMDGLVDGLF